MKAVSEKRVNKSSALYQCEHCNFYTNDYYEFLDHACEQETR